MKSRISMFIAAVAACLVTVPAIGDDAMQFEMHGDGSISFPKLLAPEVSSTPEAEGAAVESPAAPTIAPALDPDGRGRVLSLVQRRRMGFTRVNVMRAARKLAAEGALPSTAGLAGEELAAARDEIKEAIATEIMSENLAAWQSNVEVGADWDSFFQALLDFMEQFMPFLLQLIEIFNSFSHALPTPAATVADLVFVCGPPVMLAA